jgi:hypothetical protein
MARAAAQQPLPLRLVADDWRLDEHTRDVGRRGLAEARAALAAAVDRSTKHGDLTGSGAAQAA